MSSIRSLTLMGVALAGLIPAFLTLFVWVNSATAFTGTLDSRFAAKPDLMTEFEGSNPQSRETIGHNRWQSLLDAYLISDDQEPNLFRYGAVSAEDRASLDAYIASLEAVAITSYNRDEQKAYWINLYNALTVQTVLEHYPVRSIRDINISPGFFSSGPWGKKLVTVEGVDLSLDDIEHRILRPIWNDNRIHYGVNCASMGCPDLWPDVFTPDNMDAALDAAATKYINAGRGVTVVGGRVTLSKIYEWYDEDFGGTDEGVLEHILKYARKPLARNINQRIGLIKTDYDWALNAPK
ncbi:MAG: DUF547 domain-containing protein [Rhodospirillaceae bacterium]|jgi:hypothetical protein